MASWRERLCGTVALKGVNQEAGASIAQILNPSDVMSHGGGFCKSNENVANMKTFKENFVLPTENYSVMIFNEEGTAVIFSEGDGSSQKSAEPEPTYFQQASKYLN